MTNAMKQTERICFSDYQLTEPNIEDVKSIKWWSYAGSNRGPLECHSSALPAEL